MSKLFQKSLFKGLVLSASIGIASLYCAPSYANAIESGEGVFAVLASEIALQRGEAGLAYKTYLDLAQDLKDPRLAQRAMEIAVAAGSPKLALQAAQEWESLAKPSDVKPKEALITLYILNQRWSDAVPPAIALLNHQTPAQREQTLFQLQELITKTGNEAQGMSAYYEIVSALKPEPQNPEILYAYAMAAEQSGHTDVMEKTLRQILRKHPNDANSLNALGYSLADRNQNLPEAYKLISKAHEIAPQDAFILDSLGWVNFRLGKNALALSQLQKAFEEKPEADIAAHLGEVLWTMNRPAEAEDIWREGQKLDANNPTLKETLARLKPSWSISDKTAQGSWDGRFAVKITGLTEGQNQGGSGGFTLTQDELKDILEIRSPVGSSLAKITITPSEASLERNGEVVTAIDADTLIQNVLGLPLPARGLSDWLRGQARPGSNASIERNEKGQVSQITQDGWILRYTWSKSSNLEKLTMSRSSNVGSIDIRLVFDNPNE
ncbi:lipoprotein insertase outer membrane protein LolB [Polynucleobacter sphagniphilus]|uniref:lipoprotein insertase outer membrane protein LolB n=1 Tax=Polynucleobacter sphagniphilus TaxID=1743169 RepID=UPI002474D954|nr:lipoprotein insertase outer membrane protein LolB [Polynucleobacter sphagniphilus]MDH6525235.1 outer membrane biogenesis lipoprotein LolB [Polynucleobacter sphagniphilus]